MVGGQKGSWDQIPGEKHPQLAGIEETLDGEIMFGETIMKLQV